MAEDVLIRVEGLSKKFCRDLRTSLRYGAADFARELVGKERGGLRPKEFWSVNDVGFEVRRGEVMGLLGHNGAGKTTLLRVLNGLIKPDRGRVELRGRVGALIALGAGFNPILTGRENIYINAAVLGMGRAEVEARIDEIIAFSEIGEFIDSPVRNYSSGMSVRLGFSVAALLIQPDILFLDEVLAVGDIGFTIKCLNTVRDLAAGSAVVLVTHNMAHVSAFCTRAVVMDHGRAVLDADNPAAAIERYYDLSAQREHISGIGGAEMQGFQVLVDGQTLEGDPALIPRGAHVEIVLEVEVGPRAPDGVRLSVLVNDAAMTRLLTVPLRAQGNTLVLPHGRHRLKVPMGVFDFNAGRYSFLLTLVDARTREIRYRHQGLAPFRIVADRFHSARLVRPAEAIMLPT